VTIVQVREKKVDTREVGAFASVFRSVFHVPPQFLNIAKSTREVCDKYNVPLIINDRVDIALAVGAAGVHVGQEDMPASLVRRLLPSGSIVGVSCQTVTHAQEAVGSGHVDYIGIGTIFDTNTKSPTGDKLIGPRAAAKIVDVLRGTNVKSVAIGRYCSALQCASVYSFTHAGGIKANNALRVLWGTVSSSQHALDGLAVVSEIVGSTEPRQRAEKLASIIKAFKASQQVAAIPGSLAIRKTYTIDDILETSGQLLKDLRRLRPVVHQV
jgi:thiamine-phosphate diphosphorylase / hydroxyethylthiazole kinase